MIFRNAKPPFKTAHMEPLWISQITDLNEMQDRMSNHILVAFDMEASLQRIHEIGLAISIDPPQFCIGRCRFFDENKIQAFTVEVHERNTRGYEFKRHGETISVENELQAGPMIGKLLKDFQTLGKLILVGYDLQMEFKWISEHYPSLASCFSAWVDVQELVTTQCEGVRIGLTDAIQGLGIIDNRHNSKQHSAANDAVRNLAVLAGLLSGTQLITTHSSLPPVKAFRHWTEYSFSVRLATTDGGPLPQFTARDLSELFAGYDLQAVGLNRKNNRYIWWMAFYTLESLREFIRDRESLKVEGKVLKVILATGIA